jgi:hypothetical protein
MLERLNTKLIQNPYEIYGGTATSQESIITEDAIDV